MDKVLSKYLNLNDGMLLRLNKVNKIKDYFITEIRKKDK